MTLVMTLNSISLVFATLVINIKKKGDRKPCPNVPHLVMALCKNYLAKVEYYTEVLLLRISEQDRIVYCGLWYTVTYTV